MSLNALSGECTAEEMSHLTTLLQKPESLAYADKSLPDYIRVIKESAGRRGRPPLTPCWRRGIDSKRKRVTEESRHDKKEG